MTMDELEKPPELGQRKVTAVDPLPDGTYEVTLECGHRSTWVVEPPGLMSHCAQCLDVLIARLKES
jgi:hypothetical protein